MRALLRHFARRAYGKAAVAYADYQSQPANGIWNIRIACALHARMDRAAARFAALV